LVSRSALDQKGHIEKHFPRLPRQFSAHVFNIFVQKVDVSYLFSSIPLSLAGTLILQFGNNFCWLYLSCRRTLPKRVLEAGVL
jgi:hypothetical protein